MRADGSMASSQSRIRHPAGDPASKSRATVTFRPHDPRRTERRFLHTHSVAVDVPMDKLGIRDDATTRRKAKAENPCFSAVRSPKRQYYTIHPEWVSENLSIQRVSLQQRTSTYHPRRCRSAPPPRSRNPITWENW